MLRSSITVIGQESGVCNSRQILPRVPDSGEMSVRLVCVSGLPSLSPTVPPSPLTPLPVPLN